MKHAESRGLVTLDQVSAHDWNATPTSKLLALPDIQSSVETLAGGAASTIRVRVAKHKVDEIVTDVDYKGSLANTSPGEEHRLVLGVFTRIPTAGAETVGIDLARQEADRFRFRAIMKYSEFKKEWGVVAIDVGVFDSDEVWFTSKVQ